jgi:hypothetical protein
MPLVAYRVVALGAEGVLAIGAVVLALALGILGVGLTCVE